MSREKDKEKAAAAARSAKSVIRSDAVSLDWRDERDEVATAAADAAAAAALRAGEKPPPPDAAELAALPKRGQFAIDARAYGHFQKLHANLPCQTLEELKTELTLKARERERDKRRERSPSLAIQNVPSL